MCTSRKVFGRTEGVRILTTQLYATSRYVSSTLNYKHPAGNNPKRTHNIDLVVKYQTRNHAVVDQQLNANLGS